MEVISPKSSIAFGAFALSGLITSSDAFSTEHMKAFGEDCVLLPATAARTVQLSLRKRVRKKEE